MLLVAGVQVAFVFFAPPLQVFFASPVQELVEPPAHVLAPSCVQEFRAPLPSHVFLLPVPWQLLPLQELVTPLVHWLLEPLLHEFP